MSYALGYNVFQDTEPSCYCCNYARHRQNLGLVEAQNFVLSVWAPGIEGASGATGYARDHFVILREAGFLFWGKGEREGKGGDGARVAIEEMGRTQGAGRLFWLTTDLHKHAQPPHT